MDRGAVKLCPEFKNLSQDELMYIIYAYDYHSKFHQFPERERKKKAAYEVFKDSDSKVEDKKVVQLAIQNYMGLQYDSRRETIRAYQNKIDQLNNLIMSEDNPTRIGDHMKAIDNLNKGISALQEEIDRDEDQMIMQGDGGLSKIEKMHQMQTNLKEYMDRRVKIKLTRKEKEEDVVK